MGARAYLYVPGNRPDRYLKACTSGADCVIIDLEDAVPEGEKETARNSAIEWLSSYEPPVPVWIRVNSGTRRREDVQALARVPGVAGLCLAKTASEVEVVEVSETLDAAGSTLGLAPLLESAASLLRAPQIALAPRVVRLQLGETDLSEDLGVTLGPEESELLFARSSIVAACAAAGIGTPVASVFTHVADEAGLRSSTQALYRLGFRGRTCVHPRQIAVINDVFTPRGDEVNAARRLLASLDNAGGAVFLDAEGRLVDEATIRRARRIARQDLTPP